MKFEVGDMVFHTWVPDHRCRYLDKRLMYGTVVGGPVYHPTDGDQGWGIEWQDGSVANTVEKVLIKIPPEELQDKEEHETTDKSPVEAA